MSRLTNAQKAEKARERRARKKKQLQYLYEKSNRGGANAETNSTYLKARKLRESSLKKEMKRIYKYRNDLKIRAGNKDLIALEQIQHTKKKKHLQYIKNKEEGKQKE